MSAINRPSTAGATTPLGLAEPSQIARGIAPVMEVVGTEFDDGRDDLAVSYRTPLTGAQWQRVRQVKQKMMWLTLIVHSRVCEFRDMLRNQNMAKTKLQRLLAPVLKRVTHRRQRHAVVLEYSWPSIEMMRLAPVLCELSDDILLLLQHQFRYCQYVDLESIVLRGQVCNALWCVGVGTCVEKVNERAPFDEGNQGQRIFGPGDWFGELLGVAASPVTVTTRGVCHLYHITRDDFFRTKGCEEHSPKIEDIYVKECLRTLPSTFPLTPLQCQALPYLSTLSHSTLQHYAATMTPMVFRKGESLLVEGRQAPQIYIMVMGEVEYYCNPQVGYPQPVGVRRSVGALSGLSTITAPMLTYEWLGHEGIILREQQRYTCTAISNIVKVYAVPQMVLLDIIMEVPGFLIECRAALSQRRAQSLVCRSELLSGVFSLVPEGFSKTDALVSAAEAFCVTKGEPLVTIGSPITRIYIVTSGTLVGKSIGTGPPRVVGALSRLDNVQFDCDPSKGSMFSNLPLYVIGAWEMLEYATWPKECIAGTLIEGFAIPCEAIRTVLHRTEKVSKSVFHRIMNIAHQCKIVDMHDPARPSTNSSNFGERNAQNHVVVQCETTMPQNICDKEDSVTVRPPSTHWLTTKPKKAASMPKQKVSPPTRVRSERPKTQESARVVPLPPQPRTPSTSTRRTQSDTPEFRHVPRVVTELLKRPDRAFTRPHHPGLSDCVIREIEEDEHTVIVPPAPQWPTVPTSYFELITPTQKRHTPRR